MDGLSEGRIVRYVLPDGPSAGQIRPAIVVRVWDQGNGCANLHVFLDGSNDEGANAWQTSCVFDPEERKPGTWHWPTRS